MTYVTEISEATLREWLETAGAPKPWDEDAIAHCARELERLRAIEANLRATPKPRHPAERAQKAINELRNALTELDKHASADWEEALRLGLSDKIKYWYEEQRNKIHTMLGALVDLPPKSHNEQKYIDFARSSYDCFLLIVPKGKANRALTNPAMAFVETALHRAGYPLRARATLESALVTRRTKRDLTQKT